MTREKMVFEWERVLAEGEPMVKLVSVSDMAETCDLPDTYNDHALESVDSMPGGGFYLFCSDNERTGIVPGVVGSHALGRCITLEQYECMKRLLARCADNLKRIDKEIVEKEKENAGWSGTFVDEI